jgi:hypothetical protein
VNQQGEHKNMMPYVSDYTVQLLHEERLRDAERRRSQLDLLRDPSEPMPNERSMSLVEQVKQWVQARNHQHQPQEVTDVRATAV